MAVAKVDPGFCFNASRNTVETPRPPVQLCLSEALNMTEPILVTGAAGFLGRHVAHAAAARGFTVQGLGHGRANPDAGMAAWTQGDVTLETLRHLDPAPAVIFHCAGGASVAYSIDHPVEDFRRTVDSILAVLEFARLSPAPVKVVLPSSAGVYGSAARLPSRVDDPLVPVSPYGLHKRIAEDLCRSYARQYGVPVAIVRLFSVYGPGLRKQLLWDACRRLGRGEGSFAGDGFETRDWLHVEDAADLMVLAADHAAADHPVVNGAAGKAVTVRAVVETLGQHLPGAPRPTFSGERRPGDPAHYHADISEAVAWGWSPRHGLDEGLRGYVAWYLSEAAS